MGEGKGGGGVASQLESSREEWRVKSEEWRVESGETHVRELAPRPP